MIDCAHFTAGRCRSCTEIEHPYRQQLAAKDARVRSLLAAHGDLHWLPPIESAAAGFRNKAKMVVGGSVDAPILGLVDRIHGSIDLRDCLLYPPALKKAFDPLLAFIRVARLAPYDIEQRRGELKFVLVTLAEHSGELMVRFVLRSTEPLARLRKHLPTLLDALPSLRVTSVNLQPEHKAVLEGEQEILLGPDDTLTMQVGDLPLHLRPRSFFQTNTAVATALYRQARQWVDAVQPSALWDLYCGVGGFALHCAAADRDVLGIELAPEAIASAARSAADIGAGRCRFIAGDAAAHVLAAPALPPLVIVNPPRRGIGAPLAARLQHSETRWLIYSSCNAESLARDLATMPALRPRQARLLDMFPHTRHHEVIVLAERG